MSSLPKLDDLLKYKNHDVVEGFQKSFDITEEESTKIFQEMLKWLWLSVHSENFTYKDVEVMGIDDPLTIIDEMWHTFILYTPAYTRFCSKYFGEYIHHQPTTKNIENKFDKKLKDLGHDNALEFMKERKRAKYEEIYETLGHDTFVTWYLEFPEKYPKEKILELRKR